MKQKYAEKENKKNLKDYTLIPFSQRLILLPQCLRNTRKCQAEERGNQYLCKRCGACKIGKIILEAERLGYQGVYILKGGSAVQPLLKVNRPRAVLGVACQVEGEVGIKICKKNRVKVQFVSLLRDGCADTDVNLKSVVTLMRMGCT